MMAAITANAFSVDGVSATGSEKVQGHQNGQQLNNIII